MYASTFPVSPVTDAYLRSGRIIDMHETSRDMITRVVVALAQADAHFDPAGTQTQIHGEIRGDIHEAFPCLTCVIIRFRRMTSLPLDNR